MRLTLRPHPATPCAALARLEVAVSRPRPTTLALDYTATGAIADLRLAPCGAPARADQLWRTTCFEAFIKAGASDGYLELNLAPSRQWAAYRFSGYRAGMALQDAAPDIDVATGADLFALRAQIKLPFLPGGGNWGLGLCAVIEETNGRKSYWALAHPAGPPDFHHADSFACDLPPTERP